MKRLYIIGLVTVFLTACHSSPGGNPAHSAKVNDVAPVNQASRHPEQEQEPGPEREELSRIKEVLSKHAAELEEKHHIKLLVAGVGSDHIMVKVRRSGDVEQTVPEAELEAWKQALFELVGSPFPLRLSVQTCCTAEAGVSGKITSFDKEHNRILIVSAFKKNGSGPDPEATWLSLAEDGVLITGGTKVSTGLDASIVGREAKAWTTGLMLQSYPRQASALKIEVE
ncbi:hypothetical protein [Paenibacillus rigui]|uniref:Uncharacterized protein n=1 Tax=Paenibacillus rigui TaxID=554312 RepID=A0A229UGY2_9BACL|nr:hypothetical protein [Paenibacillus rigui]OXM82642.1 hypothetical protein CF651_29930 [Paenibacillus rigui]